MELMKGCSRPWRKFEQCSTGQGCARRLKIWNVRSCEICQKQKSDHTMQCLPIPKQSCTKISMDFIEGITFNFSFSYHPETDGQVDVTNRNLESIFIVLWATDRRRRLNGSPGLNFSTIQVLIWPLRCHPFKLYMVVSLLHHLLICEEQPALLKWLFWLAGMNFWRNSSKICLWYNPKWNSKWTNIGRTWNWLLEIRYLWDYNSSPNHFEVTEGYKAVS